MAIEVLERRLAASGDAGDRADTRWPAPSARPATGPDVLLLPPARNPQRESQFLWIAPSWRRPSCWSATATITRPPHRGGSARPHRRRIAGLPWSEPAPVAGRRGPGAGRRGGGNASKLALRPHPGLGRGLEHRPLQPAAGRPALPDLVRGQTLQQRAPSTWLPAPLLLRQRGAALAPGHPGDAGGMAASPASCTSMIIRRPELPKPFRMVMVSPHESNHDFSSTLTPR